MSWIGQVLCLGWVSAKGFQGHVVVVGYLDRGKMGCGAELARMVSAAVEGLPFVFEVPLVLAMADAPYPVMR